eukprot:Nk52_evm63s1444 gene=Nk52_evmTU63s1444
MQGVNFGNGGAGGNLAAACEALREACCVGDEIAVRRLLARSDMQVNNQHKLNGWTALHWASKRGHWSLVQILLDHGADPNILDATGRSAVQYATDDRVKAILGEGVEEKSAKPKDTVDSSSPDKDTFVPNYIKNPPFPYINSVDEPPMEPIHVSDGAHEAGEKTVASNESGKGRVSLCVEDKNEDCGSELAALLKDLIKRSQPVRFLDKGEKTVVLKVRICGSSDPDFYEVEIPRENDIPFEEVVKLIASELSISPKQIKKIRKLPNTVVRSMRDIRRMNHYQELEMVVL